MKINLQNLIDQKGYVIPLVFVAFAIIIGLMMFPIRYATKSEVPPCQIGDPPDGSDKNLRLEANKVNSEAAGTFDVAAFGPDPDVMTDYKMLRKNVPILKKTLERERPPAPAHTFIVGEIPERPGYDLHYPIWSVLKLTGQRSYPLPHEGIIFFIKNTPSDNPVIDENFIIADIYQDIRFSTGRQYNTAELFDCTVEVTIESPKVVVPGQEVSQDKTQLQLEWFQFGQNKYWQMHCKPAVYLYPKRKQLVNLKVFPKGELGYTDPPYNSLTGWTVTANPNGVLFAAGGERIDNDYLYYESKLLDTEIKKPTKGWVVEYGELENLFNRVLPELGLNAKEKADFENYWLGKLPKSNYYFVGLVEKEQRDYLETLSVTPNPDTSIRFSLFFEMLDEPISVEEPKITTPVRNGFTLVDWGGMVKLHPGTPFTCSQ